MIKHKDNSAILKSKTLLLAKLYEYALRTLWKHTYTHWTGSHHRRFRQMGIMFSFCNSLFWIQKTWFPRLRDLREQKASGGGGEVKVKKDKIFLPTSSLSTALWFYTLPPQYSLLTHVIIGPCRSLKHRNKVSWCQASVGEWRTRERFPVLTLTDHTIQPSAHVLLIE